MATRLPPAPLGQPPGHSFWNDWYEKLRKLVDDLTYQVANIFTGIINTENRITLGTDTVDDLIVDDTLKGLVLKSPDGNYWRVTINNSGTLIRTSLGATKP